MGTSDWARFSRNSYCVDKTLMIKELIDSETTVALFTRPRRFGKTTALRMIRAFYEGEASLFEDKQIWAAGLIPRLVFAPHFAEGAHEVVVRGHARAGDSIVLGRFTYTSPNPAPSGCLRKA